MTEGLDLEDLVLAVVLVELARLVLAGVLTFALDLDDDLVLGDSSYYVIERKRLKLVETCFIGNKADQQSFIVFLEELLEVIVEVGRAVKEVDYIRLI